LRVEIGYPAYDPIAYIENAKVLCSWGKKSDMRLSVVGPNMLMNTAIPVLHISKCQNSVEKLLSNVIRLHPKHE
jgi:hypothetical protein